MVSQQCFVFSLDNVVIEVPLSRSRWSQKEARVAMVLGHFQKFLCRDRLFLCRDRVWPWARFLCHDRIFYVAIEYGQIERFCIAIENFMLQHS